MDTAQKLTKRLIEALVPPEGGRRLIVRDTELPGFAVCIGRRAKTFVIDYRRSNGSRVRGKAIGRFGPMTVEQAREAARLRLAAHALHLGVAPEPDPPLFGELVEHFLVYARGHRRRWRQDESRIERHFAAWLPRPASAITRGEVLALVRRIGETPCERGSCKQECCAGHPIEANRAAQEIRRIFFLAEDSGLVPRGRNPAARIGPYLYPQRKRHDRSATPAEIRALAVSLWASPSATVRAVVWTLALTGLRKMEALRLVWECVNLGREDLILPGRYRLPPRSAWIPENKSDRPFVLPLATATVELLRSLGRGSEYVFDGQGGHYSSSSLDKAWQRARRRAGCRELTLHDLRATVASWAAHRGTPDRVIAGMLNHAPPGAVLSRYIDEHPGLVRQAFEDHAAAILDAAEVDSALALVIRDEQDLKIIRLP